MGSTEPLFLFQGTWVQSAYELSILLSQIEWVPGRLSSPALSKTEHQFVSLSRGTDEGYMNSLERDPVE
jgi:hypothetical protein